MFKIMRVLFDSNNPVEVFDIPEGFQVLNILNSSQDHMLILLKKV